MWRHSLHVSGFFYALRKPPAGRVGAYRIRPPTRPGRGEYVFLVFKHRFIVIQTRFKRHSNSSLGTVGEGRMRYAPTPVRASCTQLSWLASLTPPASPEAGKLAGGIRDACQVGRVHQTRTRLSSPASVDARRLPQTPRRSVHQKRELAPPPPLRPPPQEPPLELLLLPLLHERLLRSSSRSRMVDELLSFSKVSSSFS